MAKTLKEQLKAFQKQLDKELNKFTRGPKTKQLAKIAKDIVVKRSRLGFGVRFPEGKRSRFDKLSSSYVAQRKNQVRFYTDERGQLRKIPKPTGKAKKNQGSRGGTFKFPEGSRHPDLSKTTSPGKSNITFTGQLLKSLKSRVSSGRITIGPSGTRKDGKTNQQIVAFLNDQGRIFLNLSDNEINQLAQFLEAELTKVLKKI